MEKIEFQHYPFMIVKGKRLESGNNNEILLPPMNTKAMYIYILCSDRKVEGEVTFP